MEYEVNLNAYEMNQVNLYAVQGDADSRKIICHIIEKSGVVIPTSNATVVNKMLNLTDFTIKLYEIRSDGAVSVEGTIEDAENGVVSFELSDDFTEQSGIFDCAVVLTKAIEDLRIVGISLQVAKLNIEGNTNIIIQRGTTKIINIVIYNDDDTIYTLESGDKLIFGVKKSLSAIDYTIKKESTSDSKDGNGYNITLEPADTQKLLGSYLYEVALQTASGEYYIVIDCSEFVVTNTLTQKE